MLIKGESEVRMLIKDFKVKNTKKLFSLSDKVCGFIPIPKDNDK